MKVKIVPYPILPHARWVAKTVSEKYYKKVARSVYTVGGTLLQSSNVMADTSATTPGSHEARSKSVALPVLLDMADTTWRMFVPTIGLLLVGRHFDVKFGMKPWFMLAGVAVGALIAAVLIKSQMSRGGAAQ